MYKIIFISILQFKLLLASYITSNDDYKIYTNDKYEIIYTKEFEKEALFIKKNIDKFLLQNDELFGYKFDEKIKFTLVSNNYQITNAFSKQFPNNMAVLYNGGSYTLNDFSSSSWLKTIFVHEIMHNYQINAKKSKISQTLHNIFGNNSFPIFANIVPLFTYPNTILPLPFLEGNAVLNESIYNIGGRLHNAQFQALKNTLIFNNKVNPATFINNTNIFPYGVNRYLIGGYYMYYLAQKFGIQKVNQFYYEFSIRSINPLLLEKTFYNHFGVGFKKSIYEFIKYTKNKYKNFNELKSNSILSSSKSKIVLNKIDNKIYFISSNLKNKKHLNIYDINKNKFYKKITKLNNGKVFKYKDKLYNLSSNFINTNNYKVGLFDKNNKALNKSISKAILDINDNSFAYINIKDSFLYSKLYIDDKFVSNIVSNAIFDKNKNIYYFKDINNTRYLYKNKTKLTSIDTYSNKIVDVFNDEVYFISNTKNGSGIYKYYNNTIYKLSKYDNIIDAKLINKNKMLVVTVNSNSYNTSIININPSKSIIKKEKILNFNNKFVFDENLTNSKITSKPYNEFKELKFTNLYPSYAYDSKNGSIFNLNASFDDILNFNALNLSLYKSKDTQLSNITYNHSRYLNSYFSYYNIKEKDIYNNTISKNLLNIRIQKNIYKKARHTISSNLSYYYNSNTQDKKPLILDIHHNYKEQFTMSNNPFLSSNLSLLAKKDLDINTFGFKYSFSKHLINELYFKTKINYIKSNTPSSKLNKGVKIVNNLFLNPLDNTNIFIESFDYSFYTKEAKQFSLALLKNFDKSIYFYQIPLSLANETLFYKYNIFQVKNNKQTTIKEQILGLKFDLLLFHNFTIPINIQYLTNDYNKNEKINISFEMIF